MYARISSGCTRVFGRMMCSKGNPVIQQLGISDSSIFHRLSPSTKRELAGLFSSGVVSPKDGFGDTVLSQLIHFEEPTATKIVSDFRQAKATSRIADPKERVKYFMGFIKKQKEKGEGLKRPPKRLNTVSPEFFGNEFSWKNPEDEKRNFHIEEQLLLAEVKKELAYLESPTTHTLKPEVLQERYEALFQRILKTAGATFVTPYRLGPVESVFKSFLRFSAPKKSDFDAMIAVYARAFQASLAYNTYIIMTKAEIEPDEITFRELLRSCIHKAGSWNQVLEEMQSKGIGLDAPAYDLLVAGCSNTGDFTQAVKYSTEAKARGFEMGPLGLSGLLYACQALNLRDQGEQQFFSLQERWRDSIQPSDVANILLLRIRANDIDACLELRREAVEVHRDPNLCGLLVKACVDTKNFEKAEQLFKSLPHALLTERTLLSMLRAYRMQGGNLEKMKEICDMVKSVPWHHCKAVYLGYIQGLFWHGQFEKVADVWERFKSRAQYLQERRAEDLTQKKAERSEWMEWHSKADPLKEEKTYESMIRILSAVTSSRQAQWETEILPLLLSVIEEAYANMTPSPEFVARLESYYKWILNLQGLQKAQEVKQHAQLRGFAL